MVPLIRSCSAMSGSCHPASRLPSVLAVPLDGRDVTLANQQPHDRIVVKKGIADPPVSPDRTTGWSEV
jgi:hypothetical protein